MFTYSFRRFAHRLSAGAGIGLMAGSLAIGFPFSALAQVNANGTFELDGDATTHDFTPPAADWQDYTVTGPGQTGILPASGALQFIGGGSKDIYDVNQWSYTSKSSPPKDFITNAYAKAASINGDLVVFAGMDRYSNAGTADSGFWFFQQPVGPLPGGGFGPGGHTNGDLLIVAQYTTGGSVSILTVYLWENGALVQQQTGADCGTTGGVLPCGRTNTGPVPLYWSYAGKSSPTNEPGAGAFLEVGVDVSALARAAGNPTPCFSSFLAESRSSATPNSVLKDFLAGSFPVCSINVGKACPAQPTIDANGTHLTSIFNVPVTNTGLATLDNVTLTDPLVDADHVCTITQIGTTASSTPFVNGTTAVPVASSLNAGQVLNVTVSCDTNAAALNSNPFINTIKTVAQTSTVAGAPTVSASHTVTQAESCHADTSPSITVTKTCKSVNLIGGTNNPQVCVAITLKSTTSEELTNLNLDDMTVDGTVLLNSQLSAVDPSLTLAPNASVTIPNYCYTPSKPDNSTAGTNVNPESAQYSDKASVDGTGAISHITLSQSNNGVRPSGGISCKLCPPPQGGP